MSRRSEAKRLLRSILRDIDEIDPEELTTLAQYIPETMDIYVDYARDQKKSLCALIHTIQIKLNDPRDHSECCARKLDTGLQLLLHLCDEAIMTIRSDDLPREWVQNAARMYLAISTHAERVFPAISAL